MTTLQQLYQLTYLKGEIKLHKRTCAELEAVIEKIRCGQVVADVVSGSSTNYPYNQHPIAIEGLEIEPNMVSELGSMEKRLEALVGLIKDKTQQCLEEYCRLAYFIDGIPDSLTRLIFVLRFKKGLKWEDVAAQVSHGHTADTVKKICYRYIEKIETCPQCPESA